MRSSPSYCATNNLVRPVLSDGVTSWLGLRDAEAIETLQAIGMVQDWAYTFRAEQQPALTDDPRTGRPPMEDNRSDVHA